MNLFEKAMSQAAPMAQEFAWHLMGEPLAHPQFDDLLTIARKHSAPINLVSNGILLTEKKQSLLLDKIFRQVNFSLHSFSDNFPEKDPTTYLKKIFHFVETAFEIRPDLYINFRLWNLDTPSGQTTKNKHMLNLIEDQYQFKAPQAFNIKNTKSVNIRNRLYLHFDTEFVWPSLDLPVHGNKGTCYGLSSHIGILVDGTVVPCCLDKEGSIPLGNIQNESLSQILLSKKAQDIVNGFKNFQLVEELCQKCQYATRFSQKTSKRLTQTMVETN